MVKEPVTVPSVSDTVSRLHITGNTVIETATAAEG